MEMTPWEICREYRQAQYKDEQITILAHLNVCSKSDIIKILAENGIEHKAGKKRRGAKPNSAVKAIRGIPRPKRGPRYKWSEEEINKMLKLHEQGKKTAEIAAILGIDVLKIRGKLCRLARAEREVLIQ